MAETSIGVVWNPSKADEGELRRAVADAFGDADVAWWETSEDDPGRGMAESAIAAGCGVVIAVGGDGTVRAVAEALAGSEVELGIVPQGTGNLLARNLGVPLDDVAAAVRHVRDANGRAIDFGRVEYTVDSESHERGFAVMVGFGLDAQMLVETDDDLKARAGWLAYVEAMGRAFAAADVVPLTVTLDDRPSEQLEAHTVLVGNCGTIQGGLAILPDAQVDDGRLDVLMVSSEGALQWLDTVKSVVWDNGIKRLLGRGDEPAESTESTEHVSVEAIEVELSEPQPFQVDGEEIGTVSRFRVRVEPGALRVR
ncbi:MAG: diacylglycerol kinase family protein [Microbacterium sp.]|uniref:diacylglycerol/lipid kinase family protein n=1 Tax=Microbacterium sp. TaxID=51671 RepID=UPI0039E48659